MRISTAEAYQRAIAAMLNQQAALSKTQQQIASGQQRLSAADDPAKAARSLDLQLALSEIDRFGQNASLLRQRLAYTEDKLADIANVLQRVRELALNGNTATLTEADRSILNAEVQQQSEALLALANSKDGQGRWLFAGTAEGSGPPFTDNGGSVTYSGDQVLRRIEVAPGRFVVDNQPGSELFQRVPDGSGSANQDLFTTLQTISAALAIPGTDAAAMAQRDAALSTGLRDLDAALAHVQDQRSGIGLRLNATEDAVDTHAALNEQFSASLSQIDDLDYAEATGRLSQQLIALQAAQQAFVKVQGLSLFNYL